MSKIEDSNSGVFEGDQQSLNDQRRDNVPIQPNQGGPTQSPAQIKPERSSGPEENPPHVTGAGSGYGANWSFPGHSGSGPPGFGSNPYPTYGPEFFPFVGLTEVGGRLEPGDPMYIATADGPQLRLISQQLSGPENYSLWAHKLRRALVTKDKDGFLDGTILILSDDRLARQWRKCNQLVRTWIGNCLTAEVAAGVPPTEDTKFFWENHFVARSWPWIQFPRSAAYISLQFRKNLRDWRCLST